MATREEVLRVAKLARISIPDAELAQVEQRLNAVLEHFRFLSEAGTEGVEPLFHAVDQMSLRVDEPEAPLTQAELLRNAPEQLDGCFKIPRVVGAEE